MAFAQCGNSLAYLVQSLQVLDERLAQRSGQVACGPSGGTEVGCCHVTLDIAAIISASAVLKRAVASWIDSLAGLELDFTAVVQARDATEGEHERQVLGPLVCALVKADVVVGTGAVVVAINVNHVVGGVVVVFITIDGEVPHATDVMERIVDGEVNDIQSRCAAHVGGVVGVAAEDRVG